MPRVLVVEDQPNLLRSISQALREAGYEAVAVSGLNDATTECKSAFDLIILDLMLPDGDGLEWLQNLRATGGTMPVIILTARDTVQDRVKGLDHGADDYLIKPFALEELLARIRAVWRRENRPTTTVLSYENLKLDLITREVKRGEAVIDLQPRQFDLLTFLMQHVNQTVTREMIAGSVWKEATATWTNVIEVQVNQLRKKLETPDHPAILHTVRGRGYRFGESP